MNWFTLTLKDFISFLVESLVENFGLMIFFAVVAWVIQEQQWQEEARTWTIGG